MTRSGRSRHSLAGRLGHSLAGRLGLVVLGLLLGLLLTEAALQGLRSFRLVRVEPLPSSSGPGPIVVCVGDSHTYGFQVLRELESYPAQLARQLAPMGVQVENLGWPGLNGAQIATRLEQRLQAGRVDLVLVLAGYNNSWNPATTEEQSRWVLPRLWRILRSHGAGTDDYVIVDGRPHWRQPDGSLRPITNAEASEHLRAGTELQHTVRRDLERAVQSCADRQVPVVLQTYASEQNERFIAPNAAARSAAAALDRPLVDHAGWFRSHGVEPAAALQPDGHPNVVGYGHMVQALEEFLPGLKDCESWNWDARDRPIARPDTGPAFIQMSLHRTEADGTAVYEVGGPPGGTWILGVARSRESPAPGLGIPMDETFHQCRTVEGLSGTLDANGRGTARLYPHLAGQLGDGPFYLQLILVDPLVEPEDMLRAVSPVLVRESWPR